MDLKTGKVKWKQKLGFGAFYSTEKNLIYLSERGKLHIVQVSSSSYKEVSSGMTSLGKTCWTMPILNNGLLYCRNHKGKLTCIDISK